MSEVKTMTTRKIIFDSKNIPCDIAYVEWVLKSDYDALKQLSDAFYLKQVQLENQNEDLKAKLEKAVEALKEIEKHSCFCSIDDEIIPQVKARETLRELGVE